MLIMVLTFSCSGGTSEETNAISVVSSSSGSVDYSSSGQAPNTGMNFCDGFVDGTEREHYGMQKEQFCDKRDGKKYVYVEIGEQTWMAENLNYETDESWCYDDADSNCEINGRLYTFDAAQIACPAGWRLPSSDDWTGLIQNAGGNEIGGNALKSETWDGTDSLGFSALPDGYRNSDNGNFASAGSAGFWWSTEGPWTMNSDAEDVNAMQFEHGRDGFMYSVRCVKD